MPTVELAPIPSASVESVESTLLSSQKLSPRFMPGQPGAPSSSAGDSSSITSAEESASSKDISPCSESSEDMTLLQPYSDAPVSLSGSTLEAMTLMSSSTSI